MIGIGLRLRQERNRLKLSQSALGSLGGVETNAQGNYESGARSPKADYLLRIAEAGVDITFVLTGKFNQVIDPTVSVETAAQQHALTEHLGKVTHQLHRNLHGLIDALYQISILIDACVSDTEDQQVKNELDSIRVEAQSLAQASVRLIFVTSKLA
ncbi:helix-turn-helix domain-containing protein [Pseudomonas sp. NPDC090202]|uniref:helix-turn-helix domain-containing protein n=1 Tax=unclassified Pseudomonas TaxID=196821 RepID=UPI00380723E6